MKYIYKTICPKIKEESSFFECLNKIGISSDIITINDCTDAIKKVLENNSHKKDR